MEHKDKRSSFSGKIGFVLAAAGASVGLGNIWRFPYLCAKYGGGIFLLIYIILAVTFGYTMIIAETALGRASNKSPVGAYNHFTENRFVRLGGWINAIIPILIVPYYSVIGGWVCKYLYDYIFESPQTIASDTYFTDFITDGAQSESWFWVFAIIVLAIVFMGVRKGIESVAKFMMPVLALLAVVICIYSMTRPGAMKGVMYCLVPDFSRFSIMTFVSAMGQMFYSLSIAMGILITFGSYVKKDVSIEKSTEQVEIFDTAIAVIASLMIIPAVFSFSNGNPDTLEAGPSLMFITMPRIFASMGIGRAIGILFFLLVLIAAVTSAIALLESAVATFGDEFKWSRALSTSVMSILMIGLGTLSSLGYGPLADLTVFGMQMLDFFDFLTNSIMMPIAAIFTCHLVVKYMGLALVAEEVELGGHPFRRKGMFNFMIKYMCPLFVVIILASSVAAVLGLIKF